MSKDPAFRPRIDCRMCLVCLSEQMAVCFLHDVTLARFGRSQPNFRVLFGLILFFNGCAMAKAVSRRPRATGFRVRSRAIQCGICGGQSGTATGFRPSTSVFFPVTIVEPILHTHLYLHVAVVRRTNGRSFGTFQKQYSFGNRGSLD